MILKVLEVDYKGFHQTFDEAKGGWKCIIGDKEFLFPHKTAAEAAINEILKEAEPIIEKRGGTKIRNVDNTKVTKTVEMEKQY